jgi:hypothetical protein
VLLSVWSASAFFLLTSPFCGGSSKTGCITAHHMMP